jgi:hypothetical protein
VIDAFSINICNQGSWCMNQLHKFIELWVYLDYTI